MLNYRIVPAEVSHLLPIAASMRAADRREVWASHRDTPYEALSRSLGASEKAWTAIVDDAPAVVWGVARGGSVFSRKGLPWMLGTDDIAKYWLEFLKQSRPWVDLMREGYELLENYVHGENQLSIKWLRWCGFQVSLEETKIHGENFYRFSRKGDGPCVAFSR